MNQEFTAAYKQLNDKQQLAVDTIFGPVLVIAGPGTGKTQLLSTRAANIVLKGDVAPSNILCLTYTDTGANEMRQRMTKIMGPQGAEVSVHTFHSFGTWLINQYPEAFSQEQALLPLDDLGRFTLLESLLQKLPFRHQLAIRDENDRFIRQHAVEEIISAFKQAGLTPEMVQEQIQSNEKEYEKLQPLLDELFKSNFSIKRLDEIENLAASFETAGHSFCNILIKELVDAVEDSRQLGKTVPLGKWRDVHTTIKNKHRVLKSAAQSQLLKESAILYKQYQKKLSDNGRYDYDDMILWAINAMESNDDVRLDVAERFQYVMVDEYQDTNGAQNVLLDSILKANPVDSPNVLVVGDDDQAIMRFQGAEVSGMLRFIEEYKPEIIVLDDNYRSGQPILDASRQIMTQTDDRLEASLPEMGLVKELKSKTNHTTNISNLVYVSPSAQYYAVAKHVQELIRQGVKPNEIGVIGRKHAELIKFVPYVESLGIAVSYDRRENILENIYISELLKLARLINTLAATPKRASALLPEVLAADYWQLTTLDLYNLAAEARGSEKSWLDTMLGSEDVNLSSIAGWLLSAAKASQNLNFTQMFDLLLGRDELHETTLKHSPFASCYKGQEPETYLTILSHLIALREAVLSNRPDAHGLADMLEVCDLYKQSNIRLLDNNPMLRGDDKSVQIMSAHGAKGREFQHVIILSAIDEVWGNRARSNNQRIWLPENMPLYPAGDAESDRLRLFYVAMTRAKSNLLVSSYSLSDNGRGSTPLGFLALGEDKGWWQASESGTKDKLPVVETTWSAKRITRRKLADILQPLLKSYRLSPTALKDFLDFRYAGPLVSIEKHVLKFPSAYNAHSALGNAVHRSIQFAQLNYASGKTLNDAQVLEKFDEFLQASGLSEHELVNVRTHGHDFLPSFLSRFQATDFKNIKSTEQYIKADNDIPINGVLDALADDNGILRVIDYKTGKPPLRGWQTKGLSDGKKTSLHFYRQQLLFYKILVEESSQFKGQRVGCAELVFTEPSAEHPDEIIRLEISDFDNEELNRTRQLMKTVFTKIVKAELPDTSNYSQDLKGILAFEQDLLDGKI